MFERLQHGTREAVLNAKDEARRAGRGAVGVEHLLLGLLTRPGEAADALTAAGADPDTLRERISSAAADRPETGPAEPGPVAQAPAEPGGLPDSAQPGADDIPLTRDAQRALERAERTAQRHKHQRVSTWHLLFGVIDEPENPAVQALTVGGIHVGTLRTDVLRRIESGVDRFEG
jgi:ATP-dependent Clp protease ATP-binding subunit ClpA